MKIIICGAGQVGHGIAERLSEDNDVTVIDKSPGLVQALSDSLDVQGIVGHGAHPDVLERAGASDADMIIAVTHVDEVNMMACEVANAIFNVPTKIARIRAQSYLLPEYQNLFTRANTAIDVVISPELAVGDMVLRRLALPGAFEAIYFAEERVVAMGICAARGLPGRRYAAVAVDRAVSRPQRRRDGDRAQRRTVRAPRRRPDADRRPRLCHRRECPDQPYAGPLRPRGKAAGPGADRRRRQHRPLCGAQDRGARSGTRVRIIEASRERAESVAETLHRTVILHGSALDHELLREAGVTRADAYIALTNDEKVNVLSAMLAKQEGAANTMALVSTLNVRPFATPLGIDSFIDPRSVTVSTILKHVRRGRIRGVHPVQNGEGEIVEAEALETSPVVGVPLRQAKLPEGVRLGAIVRGETVVIPRGTTVIKPHDRVIVFALKDRIVDLQHMFRVSLEYF
jgi:trk system potassium uptake protein